MEGEPDPHADRITDEEIGALLAAGYAFNVINRIADTLDCELQDDRSSEIAARMLTRFGYS